MQLLSGLSPVFYRTSLCEKAEEKSGKISMMLFPLYSYARPTGKQYEGVTIVQINLFHSKLYNMKHCT